MIIKRFFLGLIIAILLTACTQTLLKPVTKYRLAERDEFYQLQKWSFDGRLALSDGKESWSASIEWAHSKEKDELKLSGPLGQGAVAITLTENLVIIDRGDEQIQQSSDVDAFIEQQLGMFIPVRALRYWVLGLTAPDKAFVELTDGFEQEKWIIQYSQMQQTNKEKWMPRKLKAHQDKTRLKLIIDNWML